MITPARRPRYRQPDDRGSIAVAVMIVMLLAMLGGALVTQSVAVTKLTIDNQRHDTALAAAQAGIADALFRIDNLATPATFCVAPSPNATNCPAPVAGSVPGVSGVSYLATYTASSNTYLIRSVAVVGGVDAALQVSATRSTEFPFALFGNSSLDFNGNNSNGLLTYDSASSAPPVHGPVEIGSNGSITCNGGLTGKVTAVYYSGGGGVSGSCGAAKPVSQVYPLPVPSTPNTYSPCPSAFTPGASGNSSPTTIAPGNYLCTAPIEINGTVLAGAGTSPTDPVRIYVILPAASNSSNSTAITIDSAATVNIPSSGNPVAADFQLLSNAVGGVGGSNGNGYTFGGVIDAPHAFLTANGCKSVYYGALVVNTLTCNGGPHLSVAYDKELEHLYNPWSVSGYTDIPAALVPRL